MKRTLTLAVPRTRPFTRYMTKTVYAYFLTDVLDAADRQLLEKNGISSEFVHKSDLTPVSTVDTFPASTAPAPSATSAKAPDAELELIGIAMVDRQFRLAELIRPSDGDSWKSAKMHAAGGDLPVALRHASEMPLPDRRHPRRDQDVASEGAPDRQAARAPQPAAPTGLLRAAHQERAGTSTIRAYTTRPSAVPARRSTACSSTRSPGFPATRRFRPTRSAICCAKKNDYLSFLFGYHEIILGVRAQRRRRRGARRRGAGVGKHCAHYSRGFGRPDGNVDKEGLAACIGYRDLELLGGPQRGSLRLLPLRSPWSTSRRGCASPALREGVRAPST